MDALLQQGEAMVFGTLTLTDHIVKPFAQGMELLATLIHPLIEQLRDAVLQALQAQPLGIEPMINTLVEPL